ncbi:hypothetical protein SAMN05519103_09559 [Rhizobiales bacterium GAS113]|nr:hypothetical protein SAMN05519103_09559 [Rhizobiales bacterium GAS113]
MLVICRRPSQGARVNVRLSYSNWPTTCATNTLTAKEVWSCKRDEGRPLGAGDQERAPNHCELLPLRAVVVSVAGKGGSRSRQVRSGETSASEPLMTCRNSQDDVETRGMVVAPGKSLGGALKPGPSGIRLGGGVNPDQALLWNVGTCRPDVKGEAQAGCPRESQSTDAGHRDGAVRSRDEGSVMGLDRRDCGVLPKQAANR